MGRVISANGSIVWFLGRISHSSPRGKLCEENTILFISCKRSFEISLHADNEEPQSEILNRGKPNGTTRRKLWPS
ncbi:hypothetical protein L6452_13138 [Arctium lappa]|uniref:Uncharacterized protein n=1 Tax=Arctium lappa TaxID=4217 RepID=A0ACB9CHA9_ARCLA|nr:hypothetical protein L6452_13138 [Arctium lappa]